MKTGLINLISPFERSISMNKTIGFVSGIIIVVVMGVSFALSFVSPLRFIEPVYSNTPVTSELRTSLNLDERYFLLTSLFFMEDEIQSLDYVSSVSIEREWPNRLRINLEASNPVACSETVLFYVDTNLPRTVVNDRLCQKAAVTLSDDLSAELRVQLRSLDLLLLQQITTITELPDYIIVSIADIEVTLYPDQLEKLSSIVNQEISSNNIDIRANYA